MLTTLQSNSVRMLSLMWASDGLWPDRLAVDRNQSVRAGLHPESRRKLSLSIVVSFISLRVALRVVMEVVSFSQAGRDARTGVRRRGSGAGQRQDRYAKVRWRCRRVSFVPGGRA